MGLTEDAVILSKLQAKELDSIKRRQDYAKRFDYYNDQQHDYMQAILATRFPNAVEIGLYPDFQNIVKQIIKRTSMVY